MGAVRNLVNELRRRGLTVHEWAGWDGRGNGGVTQIDIRGSVIHHTGSAYGFAYPELVSSSQPWANGGALCNFSGNVDGSLTVIASGLTYHAGGGYGPSQGPLAPYADNRNYYTVGLEIVYPGSTPMTHEQYNSAAVFARTVADMFSGGNLEYVRGHGEVNGKGYQGKWDPGDSPGQMINMNNFRAYARTAEADTMSATDAYNGVAQMIKDMGAGNAPDLVDALAKATVRQNVYMAPDFTATTTAESEVAWNAENFKRIVDRLDVLEDKVDALSTGTGYTLDQIATAVAAKVFDELDVDIVRRDS